MYRILALAALVLLVAHPAAAAETAGKALRPPAVPLVACDPYFSIWSPADKLTDADTQHWTGKPNRLASVVYIDGKAHRVLGGDRSTGVSLRQTGVQVLPTRTICGFDDAGITLTLTFATPALTDDLDVLSRPVTYLTYEIRSTDGREHDVSIGFDASGELTVNMPRDE